MTEKVSASTAERSASTACCLVGRELGTRVVGSAAVANRFSGIATSTRQPGRHQAIDDARRSNRPRQRAPTWRGSARHPQSPAPSAAPASCAAASAHPARSPRRSAASAARTPSARSSSCARPYRAAPACTSRSTRQSAARRWAATAHRAGRRPPSASWGRPACPAHPGYGPRRHRYGSAGQTARARSARLELGPVRHQIVVGLVKRDRHQHGNKLAACRHRHLSN